MRKTHSTPGGRNIPARIVMAVLLMFTILFATGCGDKPIELPEIKPPATQDTKPADTTPETEPEQDASLNSLRQAMVETPQLFAVAYFGNHNNWDSDLPVDPFEIMKAQAPQLCEDLPFLLEIPEDRIIGENGDLFCIVPLDVNATVAVSKGIWDDMGGAYIFEDSLYFSQSGEPILVFCNSGGFEPDTELYISGPSGEAFWYPQINDNLCAVPLLNNDWENMFYDFSPYREMLMADYQSMQENLEWEGVLPTEEDLIGNTWTWYSYRKDGLDASYSVTFNGGYLTVRWNDGIDTMDHIYENAPWELSYEDGYAVLSIDFGEFAGIRRYNLLYSQFYGSLYFGMDVLQEEMPIGWEPLYRYMGEPIMPDPMEMAGTWELAWTEVEGDRNEAEPETCMIEITTDYEGLFWISYTDNAFPDQNYADKELIIFPGELHYGCGNEEWLATVNYTGKYGTEYNVTLLYNGTLLLQNYWEMDGAPMVSYEWYRRAS